MSDVTGPNSFPEDPSSAVVTTREEPELEHPLIPRLDELRARLAQTVFGQEVMIEQILVTLLCQGHALLEGVPGTAKTLAVRALSSLMGCHTKRIQFTPDLMPSDILGTNIFNLQNQSFELNRGPVFTDLLLADEINRAPAKTQSALLEAMSERSVTIDGTRHELSPVFVVLATQNPVEFEGTYPLPEAQQDRFLLKIRVPYPSAEAERRLLQAVHDGQAPDRLVDQVEPVLTQDDLVSLRVLLDSIQIESGIIDYILKIILATRDADEVTLGTGPRGSIALLKTAKARALLAGRGFVIPDDVIAMTEPVLGHRLVLSAEAEVSGVRVADVITSILDTVDVPR